jgi:N-acetylneuraminate synthase
MAEPETDSMHLASEAPKVIAEIGCNHRGEFDTAIQLIESAADFAKVDAVKFQKRAPGELLTEEEYGAPHPNPANAYGSTYGEHREALEFPISVHEKLLEFTRDKGMEYSCSVWDVTSAREIASLEPAFIKVPSATNQHWDVLEVLCREYRGQIHISLGMTTRAEEAQLVEFLRSRDRFGDTVLYACTSGYPVDVEDLCLLENTRLRDDYGADVGAIGFSGHHLGIAPDVAATTLGATWVERHFTLDRSWKGTDHAASLEPDGLRRLTRDIRNVHKALRPRPSELLEVEVPTRAKLKYHRPD